jgi:hypothetical protein
MPLPPPAKPDIDGPDSSGNVVLSGRIPHGSYVYVDNLSSGYSAGQVLEPNTGAFRFAMQATVGDSMSMFYRQGADDSLARLFKIPDPADKPTSQSVSGTGGAGARASTSASDAGGGSTQGGTSPSSP